MITTVSPTPVARTRSSTSLGPIFGTGTVASRSGAPNSGRIIAFIVSGRGMALSWDPVTVRAATLPQC